MGETGHNPAVYDLSLDPSDEAARKLWQEQRPSVLPEELLFSIDDDGLKPLSPENFLAHEQFTRVENIMRPQGWMSVNEIFLSRQEKAGRIDGTEGPEKFVTVFKVKTADGLVSIFLKTSETNEPATPPPEVANTGVRMKLYVYELAATEVKSGTEQSSARIIKKWTPRAGVWQKESVVTPTLDALPPETFGPEDTLVLSAEEAGLGDGDRPFDDEEDTLAIER